MSQREPPSPRPQPTDGSGSEAEPERASVHGLKVVTLMPPSAVVEPDLEASVSESAPLLQRDTYVGCTVDERYKIDGILGEGGMGVVYRCTHKVIGKRVAMKLLRADLARDAEATERFLNEAKAASAIGSPHIIDISDFGRLPDGSTYFVMEYLEGVPLSTLVEAGAVPVERILHIARQLADGLAAAHQAGIVHRDLKPDNVHLVKRGDDCDFVKILDFGIAKVSSGEGKLTRAGAVFGTPHYMSPEQAAGSPVDHRGDIYALGVILYELASGRLPFDADNFMGILTQHMYKAPVPIRALVPEPKSVPPGLEAIILKCLSKRPEQRYASMADLDKDLRLLQQGGVPAAVADMMGRSGGFNVPADYFGSRSRSASVRLSSGDAQSRRRLPIYAGVAGVLTAVALVIAIFARSSNGSASSQVPVPPPSPAKLQPPVGPKEPPSATRQVVLAVEPIDAHVFRDERDLGASPVVVEVDPAKPIDLSIRRKDYETKLLRVDGSAPKLSIKLDQAPAPPRKAALRPAPRPRGAAPAPKAPAKKTNIGGGEIVNPWE